MSSSDEHSSLLQEENIPSIYDEINYKTGDIYRYLDSFEILETRKKNKLVSLEMVDSSSTIKAIGKLKTPEIKKIPKTVKEILNIDDSSVRNFKKFMFFRTLRVSTKSTVLWNPTRKKSSSDQSTNGSLNTQTQRDTFGFKHNKQCTV
jgi:hypothetical protein